VHILGGLISIYGKKFKTVIVTGGNGVIGSLVCKRLLELGYSVESWDKAEPKSTDMKLTNYYFRKIDFSDKNKLEIVIKKVLKENIIYEAIIFCHGIHEIGKLSSYRQTLLDEVFQVNFSANVFIINRLSKQIRKKIINISSIASLISIPYSGLYSSSKTAFDSWLSSARFELSLSGIDISSIIVGNINTGFNEKGRRFKVSENSKLIDASLISLSKRIDSSLGIQPLSVVNKTIKVLESNRKLFQNYCGKNVKVYVLFERMVGRNLSTILAYKLITRKA